MEEFDHLKIQLKDIISATNNFVPDKRIGRGGFGSVYKGELSRPEGLITVACKRLDPKSFQGKVEFFKEILMLSRCKHTNLISLLHFCIEGAERILVYEYASRGSLDRYLSDPSLTWTQRLKICIGVARALNYLHDPADTHQIILHRDIKSSNILLDEECNAKISDFGLSKFGVDNQPQTYDVSNPTGTPGYIDPLYYETGILSKASDVYSFGVVLFEVMCGTLCYEYGNGSLARVLVLEWKRCYEEKRLEAIISHDLLKHIEPGSLNTFSTIAYQCLKRASKERPTMSKIEQELEFAFKQQELYEETGMRMSSEELRIIADVSPLSYMTASQLLSLLMEGVHVDNGKTEVVETIGKRTSFEVMRRIADLAVSSLSYTTQSQLLLLFMKGMLVDDDKRWFSMNKQGQHYELISTRNCISTPDTVFIAPYTDLVISRFPSLFEYISNEDLRLKVKTQFLSPNVTYIINLVYQCALPRTYDLRVPFKYKLEEMREYLTTYVAHVGERGWLRTELFQFTSTKSQHYFDIQFSSEFKNRDGCRFISIEGIEFCPLPEEQEENKADIEPITYSEIDLGRKLPEDYIKIVKLSKDIEETMTLKEVYFLLRKGIYINNSKQWFTISKKSKKRLMLPARAILPEEKWGWNFLSGKKRSWLWKSLPGSRFKEVAESCDNNYLAISLQIESQLLSSDIMYACYLVYKLPENTSRFEGIVITAFSERSNTYNPMERHIYLITTPHTPIIELSRCERPLRTRKIKGHPKLRKDGWMEIQLWEHLLIHDGSNSFWVDGYLKSLNEWNFTSLIVQGIELRPAKVSFNYY